MRVFNIEITQQEVKETTQRHFKSFSPLVLGSYPKKLKKKIAILFVVKDCFKEDRIYSEKEVNVILKAIYFDYVTLRRALCDARMLSREKDGSKYWVNKTNIT